MNSTVWDRDGQAQADRAAGQPLGGLARPDRRGSIGQGRPLRPAGGTPPPARDIQALSCRVAPDGWIKPLSTGRSPPARAFGRGARWRELLRPKLRELLRPKLKGRTRR